MMKRFAVVVVLATALSLRAQPISSTARNLATTGAPVNVSNAAAPSGAGKACVTTDATHCTWQTVGSGSGTVTSVAASVPSFMSLSGSPITTSGTLAITLASQLQNLIFASPNGSTGLPTFRALVAADVPTLNQSTTGNAATATAFAANGTNCSAGQIALGVDASGNAEGCYTPTSSTVSLGNVTNDAQTKAAVVPNTAPSAGQVLAGNAGGTAYAPVAVSGDVSLASTGAATVAKVNGVAYAASPSTNTVPIITAANTATYSAIGDCQDSGGNHLNFNSTTHAISCGTSSGSSFSAAGSGTEIQVRASASTVGAVTGSSSANGGIALVNQSNFATPLSLTATASQSGSMFSIFKSDTTTRVFGIFSTGGTCVQGGGGSTVCPFIGSSNGVALGIYPGFAIQSGSLQNGGEFSYSYFIMKASYNLKWTSQDPIGNGDGTDLFVTRHSAARLGVGYSDGTTYNGGVVTKAYEISLTADATVQFGQVVMPDAGTDGRFDILGASGTNAIGILSGSGPSAAGTAYPVAVHGIAYMCPSPGTSVTRGHFLVSSATAGTVDDAGTIGSIGSDVGRSLYSEATNTLVSATASNEQIVLTSAPGWAVDDPVVFYTNGGAAISGLTSGNVYWVKTISSATITLCATKTCGTAVNITADGVITTQYIIRLPQAVVNIE